MNKSLGIIITIIIVALIAGGVYKFGISGEQGSNQKNIATFAVKRGSLTISILEAGTIKAREQEILKSEVEGRNAILSLIPEGTRVKKGELLVELDGSELLDKKIDQQIRVENGEAEFIRARETLAVTENQAKSDVDKAELTLEFAKQDLEKYLKGEYPNELKKAESNIELARESVSRSKDKLEWSERLYKEKFISQTELQADQLEANKDKVDLEIAQNNLALLKNYTYKRRVAELESDLSQAEMALERSIRKAKADVVQAQANLRAKESEYKRQQTKLGKIEEQITKTKIYAPSEGLVIYATSAKGSWRGNQEPLDEGQEVREREELIYLPTTSSSKAEVNIHETNLDKITPGLTAKITIDALPGKAFTGTVAKIAPLPDPQRMWMNPDLKVYNTDIHIDGNDESLRTGMSCMAEIIIEKYQDALYIPVQAVLKVGGKPTVYVINDEKIKPVTVETGLDNNRMIIIKSGLSEGQKVLLAPPLSSAEVEEEESNTTGDAVSSKKTVAAKPSLQGQADQSVSKGKKQNSEQQPRTEQDGSKRQKPDMSNMTEEQKQKMKEAFENMTEEEKENMRKKVKGQKPGQ
jgi:HlyD family secretion protein